MPQLPILIIKKLMETEVSKITGLSKQDIERNSISKAARKRKESKFIPSSLSEDKQEKSSVEQH